MAKHSSFTAALQDIIIQLRNLRWCHDKWRIKKWSGQSWKYWQVVLIHAYYLLNCSSIAVINYDSDALI